MCSRAAGLDDGIHQNSGHANAPGIQRAGLRDALDLADHHPAGVAGCQRHRQRFEPKGFPLHGDVSVGVGCGAADQSDVNGKCTEQQMVLAGDPDHLDEVLDCGRVHFRAFQAWIDERANADLAQGAGLAGGNVPVKVRDDPFGQVVGLDYCQRTSNGDSQIFAALSLATAGPV